MLKKFLKIGIISNIIFFSILIIFMMMIFAGGDFSNDNSEVDVNSPEISIDLDDTEEELYYPMSNFVVTADYGIYSPFGEEIAHYGTDIDVIGGGSENIYSMGTGYVYAFFPNIDGRGNAVYMLYKLKSGEYISVCYFHLSSVNVNVGDEIDPNTLIGILGTTGFSTAKHLHIEIATNMSTNPTFIEHLENRRDLRTVLPNLPTVGTYHESREI